MLIELLASHPETRITNLAAGLEPVLADTCLPAHLLLPSKLKLDRTIKQQSSSFPSDDVKEDFFLKESNNKTVDQF